MSTGIIESAINVVSEGTRIEGKVIFDRIAKVYGVLVGEVHTTAGTTLILSETGVIEGNVYCDTILVDGFIKGDITAKTKVVVSGTGRIVGNIKTPSLSTDFGSHFEGRCAMEDAPAATASP